ncbi:MAG: EipA family protein [Rhizobiaceae bacterium]
MRFRITPSNMPLALLSVLARSIAASVVMLSLATATMIGKAQAQASNYYTVQEIVDAGHGFFGSTSGALAGVVERTFSKYGLPNGYILGEEASGAFIGGLRYGEGILKTKNAGDHKIYWQGPSIGWDYGLDGNRTMMLVYNMPTVDFIYNRFYGVSGSAFVVGGLGVTALTRQGVHLVPIRTGIGARLGVNIGYLKLTRTPKVNPF